MRLLALDLSTSTGWALFESEGSSDRLVEHGRIELGESVLGWGGRTYPWSHLAAIARMGSGILALVEEHKPDLIVIEETTGGGRANRYSMKILEWLHHHVLSLLEAQYPVHYVDVGEWRRILGIRMTPEDKRQNARLSRAKSKSRLTGEKLDKKELGVSGKVTIKHVTLRWVNARFGLQLLKKDDDIADAICVGLAALRGASFCDGT